MLFSILIPVRDDPSNLRRCLRALGRQDLRNSEVLVCDDGSVTALEESDLQNILSGVRLFRQRGQGPATARNFLAQKARGEFLFFLDSDTEVQDDTIDTARRVIRTRPELDAFIGSYDDEPTDRSLISTYKNLAHHYFHQTSSSRIASFWCGCGVIRRDVYLEFGGLSEEYSKPSIEDIELGMRLGRKGVEIRLIPSLRVKHNKTWTFRNWIYTDLLLRGIPWVRLMDSRKQWLNQLNFKTRDRIAGAVVLGFFLSLPLWLWSPYFAVVTAASFFAFLLLNQGFLRFIRRKQGWLRCLAMVPLHLLYYTICLISMKVGLLANTIEGKKRYRSKISDGLSW